VALCAATRQGFIPNLWEVDFLPLGDARAAPNPHSWFEAKRPTNGRPAITTEVIHMMIYIKLLSIVHERMNEERGAVASEYAVLLALIAVALVGTVGTLSGAIQGALTAAAGAITGAP